MKRGITFVGAVAGEQAAFPASIAGGDRRRAAANTRCRPARWPRPSQRVMTLRPAGQYDFESGSSVAAAEDHRRDRAVDVGRAPARLAPQAIVALLRASTPRR